MKNFKANFFCTFIAVFLVDQTTKFFVSLFSEELQIAVSYNSGVSLGFLSDIKSIILTLLLSFLILFLFKTYLSVWQENQHAAALFFGGAVSNIFDRILFGSVRDWIYIPFTQVQNNVADIAIFLGLILLVFHSFQLHSNEQN